jgi:hypothetical protein
MAGPKRRRRLVELRGHYGLWQLEASCGQCGIGRLHGAPGVNRPEDMVTTAMKEWPFCDGVFMGKPDNRCGWPMSFWWIFVPVPAKGN